MEDPKRISFEEYERMEALSDDRLEYYDGVVVRMESPSMQHELIVTNVGDALAAATRQAGCRKVYQCDCNYAWTAAWLQTGPCDLMRRR